MAALFQTTQSCTCYFTLEGKSSKYGRSRTSAKSFFVHHTQQLSAAAQVGDAKAIRRKITALKRARQLYEGRSQRTRVGYLSWLVRRTSRL